MAYKSKLVLAREALVRERAEELRVFILKKIAKISRSRFREEDVTALAFEMALIMIAEAEMEVS